MPTPALVTFIYKDIPYVKVTPAKYLFKSNMVHEVINRGDIFAVRLDTGIIEIVPGDAEVVVTGKIEIV